MAAACSDEGETSRITKGIENAVKQHFKESDADSLTVNGIRSRAEVDLSLDKGFLRTDTFWRDRSKIIIRDEFERQNDVEIASNSPTPASSTKKVPNKKKKDTKKKAVLSKRTKRSQLADKASCEAHEQRISSPAHGDNTPDVVENPPDVVENPPDVVENPPDVVENPPDVVKNPSDVVENPPDAEAEPPSSKKRQSATNIVTAREKIRKVSVSQHKSPEPRASDVEIVDNKSAPAIVDNKIDTEPKPITKDDSESELSEVLDIAPVRKKRAAVPPANRKSSAKVASSSKTAVKSRPKKLKENTPVDADTEKIRDLQGWLLKCGVRKVWGRELAKFSTTQERINHLRGMLAEIGMTGRYSNEKAKKIKEERELAADLEAVQEGAKAWGAESSEQMKTRSSRTVEAPPKTRKLIRPPELAFLDDQSEDSE